MTSGRFAAGLLGLLMWMGVGVASAQDAAESTTASMPVVVVRLDEVSINPVTAQLIGDQIKAAEAAGALLVLHLYTPGGLLQSTREIVKALLASRAPVVTYVGPPGARAASAGMFVTLASHVAAMAPGTHIGAATPVSITGAGKLGRSRDGESTAPAQREDPGDAMSNKVMNDTVAWAESIAERRGRSVAWVREAVAEARSSPAEEALRLGAIDLIADDMRDLLLKLDGRRVTVAGGKTVTLRTAGVIPTQVEMTLRQRLLNTLASPSVAYVLLLAGLALIYIEIAQPGGFLAGLIGAVCLMLAAFGLQMLPTDYLAVLLIAAGLGMIVAEVKVTSYGLLTVAGAVCLFVGSLMLIDSPPGFSRVPTGLIVVVVGVVTAIMAGLVALVARTHKLRSASGEESLIGGVAEVLVALQPDGKVFFNGTYWDATSAAPAGRGEKVRVVGMDRLRLLVEPLRGDAPPPPENRHPEAP